MNLHCCYVFEQVNHHDHHHLRRTVAVLVAAADACCALVVGAVVYRLVAEVVAVVYRAVAVFLMTAVVEARLEAELVGSVCLVAQAAHDFFALAELVVEPVVHFEHDHETFRKMAPCDCGSGFYFLMKYRCDL